jgi:small neutral amino acid transporter SnatA (MarC family)|tara:strand:+ start:87 stop:293 length:207 start_codon:yes stop_codon:yes gene_type:complete
LILPLKDGKYTMGETILFMVFVALSLTGGWLILRRTGNYDIDFFTKILGWILLIPGILGIMDSLRILQ